MTEAPVLTEEQWCYLGKQARAIRDTALVLYVDVDRSVKKSSAKSKNLRKLIDLWSSVRCTLDDAVSGAYSMDVHSIGPEKRSITQIFYGGGVPESSGEPPLKRSRKKANQPGPELTERIQELVQSIYAFMELVNKWEAVRFERHVKPFVATSKKLTKCLDVLKE